VSKELAVLATVAAGGLAAAQAPANNIISTKVGDLGAVAVNFVIGSAFILVVAYAFAGGIHIDESEPTPRWYYWIIGGLGGVFIVLAALVAVRELGASGVTAAIIAGQLGLSVVLDRLGVLGLPERGLTWEKLFGIALLGLGVFLIVRE
jgi:bacterial/archaeal transporter family-2 protein